MVLLRTLGAVLTPLRLLIVAVLGLGIPLFVYLAFIADEPVFDAAQDVALGRQSVAAIEADPEQFPLLSRESHREAYAHLQRLVDTLLRSPEISQ